MLLFALILFNSPASLSQSVECGSLITYRQFDELLTSAPECLRSGCQPRTTQLATASFCPPSSPCHAFWDLLRQEWQQDWCSTCPQDIACRIDGWPILNGTSACARSPNEWLFANSLGGCCANDQEPFDLAAWTGRLCNGSEWREPFELYGGMARDDWIEWMQPWNWTVHRQNETDRNFTQVVCESAKSMQVAFAVDNIISAGWAVLELFVYWLCCICAWNVVMDEVRTWRRSLGAGLVTGGLYLVSNFATSIMWDLTPGYRQIPTGYVGLLLCARPSILGFLSLVSIWGRGKVERSIPADGRAMQQQRERSWLNKDSVKEWRRAFGTFLRRFGGSEHQNARVTDEDLADGRETAKQLLAGFALTIGVSELVLQVSGVYSIFKTAIVGGTRGFYSRNALLPFYGGSAASRMYGGALFHCVFLFPSTFGLVWVAWTHAKEQEYHRLRRYLDANDRRKRKLQNYYDTIVVGRDLTEAEKAEARKMFNEQRLLEHSLLGPPGLRKRVWIRTKEFFAAGTAPTHRTWPPAERGSFSTKLHNFRVNLTLALTRPLNYLVQQANGAHQPTDTEAAPADATAERNTNEGGPENQSRQENAAVTQARRIKRQIRLLAGRVLSMPLIRTRISGSFAWADEEDRRRRTEREDQERGPNRDRFNDLVRRHEQKMSAELERSHRRPLRRSPVLLITSLFVSMNYISQWLFWSGYVEIAGERWCPPNAEFNIEKGIWAAIAAVALLVSVILSSSTESGPVVAQ